VIKVKTEHLSQKLLLLKELDETIDFSKSTLQIEVMFTFLMGKEKLTPSELVEVLDERRKAVLDALRKMQLKGIIKKEGEVEGEPVYVLTESGLRYSKKLKEALGLSTHDNSVQINEEYISNREKIASLRRIIGLYYVYNAILYLANSPGGRADLYRLSALVGLSPERMKSYLDAYSRPPMRIFKRQSSPLTRKTFYKLEKEGWGIYYKTHQYQQLKEDPISKFKIKLRIKLWRIKRLRETLLFPAFFASLAIGYLALNISSTKITFTVFFTLLLTNLVLALISP